jgi:hypothetical protein
MKYPMSVRARSLSSTPSSLARGPVRSFFPKTSITESGKSVCWRSNRSSAALSIGHSNSPGIPHAGRIDSVSATVPALPGQEPEGHALRLTRMRPSLLRSESALNAPIGNPTDAKRGTPVGRMTRKPDRQVSGQPGARPPCRRPSMSSGALVSDARPGRGRHRGAAA